MRGRSRPPAWYEAILERRGRSAHLEDLARWSRPLRGMAVECLDVQLVLEFLGADGVLGRVKWMHFMLGTEHRPIQTGADRGRARNETRPLVGGLMGRTLPRARVDVGLSTPPTVSPPADDGPTTDSPVNETQSQVGSRRRRRVGLRCRLSHHPRGRTGFKRNIAPLNGRPPLPCDVGGIVRQQNIALLIGSGLNCPTRPTTTAQQPFGQAGIRCYVGSLGRPPCDDAPPSTGLRTRTRLGPLAPASRAR